MKNIKSTFKVLRTDVELDFKEISYLVETDTKINSVQIMGFMSMMSLVQTVECNFAQLVN